MNIYLDIDGVLTHDSLERPGQPANGVVELLRMITSKHDCYWLTTHCRGGENHAVEHLSKKLPAEALPYLNLIKPTDWSTWKTEAIDFSQDFRWIDDDVYEPELEALRQHNCEDKLICVDLKQNPDFLKELASKI